MSSIARALEVSVATVSYAFTRPDKLSEPVRARVLAEAARQGYSGPDPAARQLSRGRSDTLGLLFTDELAHAFADPAAVRFLQGLSESCQGAGLNLLLISSESSGGRPDAVANAVVDGFVVYSVPAEDPHLARIRQRRLPTVVVDSPPDLPESDWVGADDRAGGRLVGELVAGLGHERIGVITAAGRAAHAGPTDLDTLRRAPPSVHRNRILGLVDALAAEGLPEPVIEQRPELSRAAGADALTALLAREPELTAVCSMMDVLALGALETARRRGLTIPDDLTITGYDGIPEAAAAGLTTVCQPLVDKGRLAGDLYLSHRPGQPPRRRMLPVHVQVRSSSGPARRPGSSGRPPRPDGSGVA